MTFAHEYGKTTNMTIREEYSKGANLVHTILFRDDVMLSSLPLYSLCVIIKTIILAFKFYTMNYFHNVFV